MTNMKAVIVAVICLLTFFAVWYLVASQMSSVAEVENWQILTKNTDSHSDSYDQVFFSDAKNGIVRSVSYIKKTSDGGNKWEIVKNWAADNIGIYSLTFDDEGIGWAIGTNVDDEPIVMKSVDQGVQWQRVRFDEKELKFPNGKLKILFDLCFDSNGKIWLVGQNGILEAKENGNNLEVESFFETKETLYGISCSNSGEIWAVGEKGSIFHFKNGWTTQEIKENYIFKNIKLNGSEIWVFGFIITPQKSNHSGILLRSVDNGNTWENKTPKESDVINDLNFINKDIWLVGGEGNIFHSSNNGGSWTKSKSPTKSDLRSIYLLDSNNVWISGDKETVLKLIR